MMTPAPPLFPDAAGSRSWLAWLGRTGLVLLVWLRLLQFPELPPLALDPSWRMALSYLTGTNLQFGTDIVFTYGPLGYLLATSGTGFNFGHHLVWQLGMNLVFAATIVAVGLGFRGVRLLLYYTFFLGFAVGYGDVFQMIMVLLYSLLLLQERVLQRPGLAAACAAVIGILALVKFTNLLFAGFAVACIVGWLAWGRRWRTGLVVGGAFAVTFLGGWLACGQSLFNLPAFIINSLSISEGYVDAMGIAESPRMLLYGLTAGLALVVYLSLHLTRGDEGPRALAAWAISGAGAFLNWKHGFVRADGHVVAHFFFCLAFMATHRALLPVTCAWPGWRTLAAATCTVASLGGTWLQSETTITNVVAEFNRRLQENVIALAGMPEQEEKTAARFRTMKRELRLPVLQALGHDGRRVDIMGHDIGYAVLNDAHYRPRPTLQGYAALTPRLARLNAEFMADPARAPDLVLYRIQTIDNRLPTLDDAPALRYLYHHYDYMLEESGFLYWTRRDSDPALDTRELLGESVVGFGETIVAPVQGDDMIWCELEIEPSLLGRLRTFLYKPPPVHALTDDGGADRRRMLIAPAMARAGFLVHPYFSNHGNIMHHAQGNPAPRLMRFELVVDPTQAKYFDPEIRVRFFALPPMPRPEQIDGVPDILRYRALNRFPDEVDAPMGATAANDGSGDQLLVHAPSALHFTMSGDTRRLTGGFGLFSGAYTGEGGTDGVEFRVEWTGPDGATVVLWHRLLEPRRDAADRGSQRFAIDLPQSPGTLTLRTTPGPAGEASWDWAYWTDVRFEK